LYSKFCIFVLNNIYLLNACNCLISDKV